MTMQEERTRTSDPLTFGRGGKAEAFGDSFGEGDVTFLFS